MKEIRFQINSRHGVEVPDNRHKGVGSVLSLAIQRALQDKQDGNWTVREYEDDLYRVHKEEKVIWVETLR